MTPTLENGICGRGDKLVEEKDGIVSGVYTIAKATAFQEGLQELPSSWAKRNNKVRVILDLWGIGLRGHLGYFLLDIWFSPQNTLLLSRIPCRRGKQVGLT